MGILFKSMLGSSASTNSGSVYTHTYTMGQTVPSFTTEIGRASTDGTVNKFAYLGCKIADWELSLSTDALFSLTATIDAKSETSATSGLTTPSYASALETYAFVDSNVLTLDGSTVAAVSKINLKGQNPLANERVFLGNAGTKAEQVVNDFRAISGTIEADFTSKAALYDSFTAKTELTLQFKLTSTTIIASSTPFSFQVDIPALFLEGEDGVDALLARFLDERARVHHDEVGPFKRCEVVLGFAAAMPPYYCSARVAQYSIEARHHRAAAGMPVGCIVSEEDAARRS
jgi:hypothetical protein